MNRRAFVKVTALASAAAIIAPSVGALAHGDGNFTLPKLPYAYNALEPHIDAMTMEIHHSKHHQAYIDNLNKLVGQFHIHDARIEYILANTKMWPPAVRNNAGGHWNHSFFWESMKPGGGGIPSGKLLEGINATFNNFDNFKKVFSDASKARFGSGWAWLIKNNEGKLEVISTPNQDNPLMDIAEKPGIPLLGLDVWEHAYYLKYQNKRGEYIDAWWNVINWESVAARH